MNRRGVEYVVIGGWAAIAHGLSRTSSDVDLFVKPTRENVDRLIQALSQVGFGIAKELTPEKLLGRWVNIFADQIRVDILTQLPGLTDFDEVHRRRWNAEFEGITIPFASIEDLMRSKDTSREQDIADVAALREIAKRKSSGPAGGS